MTTLSSRSTPTRSTALSAITNRFKSLFTKTASPNRPVAHHLFDGAMSLSCGVLFSIQLVAGLLFVSLFFALGTLLPWENWEQNLISRGE